MKALPALLLLAFPVVANDLDNGELDALDSSMIIDNTITRIGHEFTQVKSTAPN